MAKDKKDKRGKKEKKERRGLFWWLKRGDKKKEIEEEQEEIAITSQPEIETVVAVEEEPEEKKEEVVEVQPKEIIEKHDMASDYVQKVTLEEEVEEPAKVELVLTKQEVYHNKFDRFFIKIYSSILVFIAWVSRGINKAIKFIFRREAPLKYVKAFVSFILIILLFLLLMAPFRIEIKPDNIIFLQRNNLYAVQQLDKNWVYVDKKGKVKIRKVAYEGGSSEIKEAKPFAKGVAFVKLDDKHWHLINEKGKLVIKDKKFKNVGEFFEKVPGRGEWMPAKVECAYGGWLFINSKGKEINEKNINSYDEVSSFKEGLARVRQGRKEYFIDTAGKKMFKDYDEIRSFNCGYAAVKTNDGWGFINKKGDELLPPTFNAVSKCYNTKDGACVITRSKKRISIYLLKGKNTVQVTDGAAKYCLPPYELNKFMLQEDSEKDNSYKYLYENYSKPFNQEVWAENAGQINIEGYVEK